MGRVLIKLFQLVDQSPPGRISDWRNIIIMVLEISMTIFLSSQFTTSSLCRSSASDILCDTGMLHLLGQSHGKSEKDFADEHN